MKVTKVSTKVTGAKTSAKAKMIKPKSDQLWGKFNKAEIWDIYHITDLASRSIHNSASSRATAAKYATLLMATLQGGYVGSAKVKK